MRKGEAAACNSSELARRMRAFISDPARGGPEIADMIGHLGAIGEVAIFGGMPRDIAKGGADAFRSDVDLVVDTSDDRLAELLRSGHAVRNRFGGYRLKGQRHTYDIWALQSTWAVRSGHVPVSGLADLIRTTFFDRDAVVYLCNTGRIHHARRYWSCLKDDTVDINLEANPNVEGAIVRALRLIVDCKQKAGPRLVQYLADTSRTSSYRLDPATMECLQALTTSWSLLQEVHHTAPASLNVRRKPRKRYRARSASAVA
ncbi:hypothetical protein FPV16_07770 [Methylobacterium sp. W2]|uniref:hypothetical protein n=1 Tax=Methylobacterium sp. W2 TaxID=2598107 RepID=UPI001D0BF7FE|nr:hypothetical protein [Methylobacterium sp. W2]MCC0806114.1 hypothetical protein [Methylobacterium sp. W2]